jgi:capsular polysaccharide biosynthesis protein
MNETTDASAIFAPLWRRKWLILAVGILVAAGAYEYYKRKPTTYAVKTQLYLGGASEGQALLNNTLGKTTISSTALANQVQLIQTTVAESVRKQLHHKHGGAALGGKVKAKAANGSDFITITAEARTARGASLLANTYARAYVHRHQANYERSVNTAIQTTRRQIRRIEAASLAAKSKAAKNGGAGSSSAATLQAASLNTKLNQLESDLTVNGVQQVAVAKPGKAELVGPKPRKNAIFGFAIGIVLATLAVYILSRFDRRLRTLSDIEAAFQPGF